VLAGRHARALVPLVEKHLTHSAGTWIARRLTPGDTQAWQALMGLARPEHPVRFFTVRVGKDPFRCWWVDVHALDVECRCVFSKSFYQHRLGVCYRRRMWQVWQAGVNKERGAKA
jgi:hypothetical protein